MISVRHKFPRYKVLGVMKKFQHDSLSLYWPSVFLFVIVVAKIRVVQLTVPRPVINNALIGTIIRILIGRPLQGEG